MFGMEFSRRVDSSPLEASNIKITRQLLIASSSALEAIGSPHSNPLSGGPQDRSSVIITPLGNNILEPKDSTASLNTSDIEFYPLPPSPAPSLFKWIKDRLKMHHILALMWFLYLNYLLGAFICFSLFLIIFAVFGVETGIHKNYVKLLLYMFEFCRQTIEKKKKKSKKRRKAHRNHADDEENDPNVLNAMKHAKVNKINCDLVKQVGDQISEEDTTDGMIDSQTGSDSDYSSADSTEAPIIPPGAMRSSISSKTVSDPKIPDITRILMMTGSIDDSEPRDFQLSDIFEFIQKGVHDIVDDEVTKRFDAEEIRCWNLLTRTNRNYQFSSIRLMLYWLIGFIFRFYLLFPIRLAIFAVGMIWLLVSTALVGLLPDSPFKRWIYSRVSITAFRILSRSVSSVVTYHNEEYRPRGGGICVANHTSPFDVVMLHCDTAYALVGQLHDGYLGIIERALSRATSHCFFDRSEMVDREVVKRKMTQHVSDNNKLPILIFPEGTCINNSAVMKFKKGAFEVEKVKIYPVAIKYDPIFGDPFWNSHRYGFFTYVLRMMSSWAIVCHVWYLPPMRRMENEDVIQFTNRVKAAIAKQGRFVNLQWDGQLKREKPRQELKDEVKLAISRKISVRSATPPQFNQLNYPNHHHHKDSSPLKQSASVASFVQEDSSGSSSLHHSMSAHAII